MEDRIEAPFYPIIYVRGYAGTDNDIEDTVSDPYMGFNLGSTKSRQLWTGALTRQYFESPLVRLMKDYGYRDVYSAGLDMAPDATPSARSIIIYRYYDQVSTSFGTGRQIRMEDFAKGLGDLVERLRARMCGAPETSAPFRVHLVGHSMGGLVIRSFLQNPALSKPETRALVDKVFTYATPHNGIDLDVIGNVPAFFTASSLDNFNRDRMCQYLGLPPGTDPVRSLNGMFDVDRMFCLVGTNAKDYAAAKGWSARVVGPLSDGLVRINNAVASGNDGAAGPERLAARAFVDRSHSGYYGIVNSEEGYQNLVRFLFGDVRIDGTLEVASLSLPKDVEAFRAAGRRIRASYNFECVTRVRGANWDLSRRVTSEYSAIMRQYDDLFPKPGQPADARRQIPELFAAFLSKRALVDPARASLGFSIDLGVLVPEYEVDGTLWLRDHYGGGYLYRDKINVDILPPEGAGGWTIAYGFDSSTPNRATIPLQPNATIGGTVEFRIPILQSSTPGIAAELVLRARAWNAAPPPDPDPQQVSVE